MIEVAVFLGDTGFLPFSVWKGPRFASPQTMVGEIQVARRHVRRRGFESSIWEDSSTRDQVYENDAVLTLSDSSAKLKLKNNVNLELHENTLVVLEADEDVADKPFRLRFSRGDLRSQNGQKGIQLKSGDWSILAAEGTDLSLRAVDSQRVEVEVHGGAVQVTHSVHGQMRELAKDQRLTLFPEEASQVQTASTELAWADPRPLRVYGHQFPVSIWLQWQGEATHLEVMTPTKGIRKIPLEHKTDLNLELPPGSHHLTLTNGDLISRTLFVQVVLAPKIIHLTPLPRDRVKTGDLLLFAWLSEFVARSYRLEIAADPNFKNIVHGVSTPGPRLETAIPVSGDLHWRVIAFDEDNAMVPAAYSYPLISHPDPLAPPELRAPTSLESEDGASVPGLIELWWQRVWDLIFPQAHGTETKNPRPPPVILNWGEVQGAEFYIIEISSTSDFTNPEVVAKVFTNNYAWVDFNKQVYYYRVAGGAKGKQVGYFSKPDRLDLTNWPPPSTQRSTNSAPSPARPKTIPPPEPSPSTPPPADFAPEASASPPMYRPTSSEFARREDHHSPSNWEGKFWWRSLWNHHTETAPESVKAEFSGGTFLGFGVEALALTGSSWWRLSTTVESFEWKPKSKTELPFQSEQSTMPWFVTLHRAPSPTGWAYGLGVGQRSVVERSGLESIQLKTEFVVGPSLRVDYAHPTWSHWHAIHLLYGQELPLLLWANNLQWRFTEALFVGVEGHLSLGAGSDRTLSSVQLGVQLGVAW